jgi:hypothetical protein
VGLALGSSGVVLLMDRKGGRLVCCAAGLTAWRVCFEAFCPCCRMLLGSLAASAVTADTAGADAAGGASDAGGAGGAEGAS